VNLEAGRSNKHLLEAANDVADRFQAAVIGSAACAPIQMLYAEGYAYGDVLEQDQKEIATELERAEAEFRDAMGNARVQEWRQAVVMVSLAGHLASLASRADLVMVQAAPDGVTNTARQIDTGDLIMQAGRPILLVAPAPVPVRMDRVLIAWKDTSEARRAAAGALPLLKRASCVSLVEIADEDDVDAARSRLDGVAAWLLHHGVKADVHAKLLADDDATDLAAVADELEADIVVAGAYGHSRVREWALGGVTRTLVRHTARPSLVSH
jgi:nucleotide-binding universal stress UspA family protein